MELLVILFLYKLYAHINIFKFVGAIIMNLSKDFDCIPHKLLIAKVHAYAFDLNSYSYLKNHKQNVKINNTCDIFQILLKISNSVSLKDECWEPFYSIFL